MNPVPRKTFILATPLMMICMLAGLGLAAREPQPTTVAKVVVTAKPDAYSGRCPTTIEFNATIFVTRPATVQYRWERSDGVVGPREVVEIRSSGKGVSQSWQVGVARKVINGWVRLHVLAPNEVVSNQVAVQVKCS